MICPFYGNYSTLDSHTNTVISHGLLVKMASKTRQGLLRFAFSLNSVTASFQSVEALFSETDEAGFVSRFLKSTFIKHKSKQGSVTYYK